MDALSAQVQSAVEAGDYGQLAPVLDAAELQVRPHQATDRTASRAKGTMWTEKGMPH